MDSRSRRLPFCLSSSRSSYSTAPTVSSASSSASSLGSSRLYSRETTLNNDRLPRISSAYKTDLDQPSSRLFRSSRDYSSSDSHTSSWKLPPLSSSSSRSYDRPWAESPLGSRSKLSDSEGRLGMRSVLLNATDDGDSKRAKLSYSNRGLYPRTASTSVSGSTYSTNGLSSGRAGTSEKQHDPFDSYRSSCRLLSRSSSPSKPPPSSSSSRRELEKKTEPSFSVLGEGRLRSPGLASSLYHTDRVTSTYAQGARPKETTYSPSSSSSSSSSSYSSSARESSLNRHLSSSTSRRSPPPLVRDFSSRTSARYLSSSSTLNSSQEQMRNPTDIPSSYSSSSRSPWTAAPHYRSESTLPQRLTTAEGGEPEGHRSTRCFLSRLFSRRSSQDSSSSSIRSLDDDSPSTGAESVDSDEGARMASAEPEATSGGLRNRRPDLTPIQENNGDGYRSGLAESRMWREPIANTGSRRPPLLTRLRRYTRDDGSAHSAAGLEEGYSRPQNLLRRWDNLEHKASQDDEEDDDDEDDDDEDDEEKEEGAVGLEAFGTGLNCRLEDETLPELEDASVRFSPRRRLGVYESISASAGPLGGVEASSDEKPVSSRDQEKLRKIKERLLLEDSDEEEGDLCRICQMGEESASNPLIQPCRCTGSLQYVHQECIKRWLCSKIGSGTNLEAITTCELCKEKLRLNIDNFDVQELYRTHVQSEYDEVISSGLYLVVLLHFCEQRFSDILGTVDAAGLFSLVRILHEHMDNLEIPHGESDEEVRDDRPSIEFSDLDDDLEEY